MSKHLYMQAFNRSRRTLCLKGALAFTTKATVLLQ